MKIRIHYGTEAVVLPGQMLAVFDRAAKTDMKVLLCLCADPTLCRDSGNDRDDPVAALCRASGCTPEQVRNALSFLRGAGLIDLEDDMACLPDVSAGKEVDRPVQASGGHPDPERRERPAEEALADRETHEAGQSDPEMPVKKLSRRDELPNYTSKELADLMEQRKEASECINECQRIWGKIFNTQEINILLGLVDYLGLDWEYVLTLLAYCEQTREKTGTVKSLRAVEKTAFRFYDDGITDVASLQTRIKELEDMRRYETQLRQMFGMSTRTLTAREKKIFSTWLYEYRFGEEIVRYAYELTVDRLSNPNINYTNAILKRWHDAGIHTVEQIEEEERQFQNTIRSAKHAGALPERSGAAARTAQDDNGKQPKEAESEAEVTKDLDILRRLLNIENRPLTTGEKQHFRIWLYDFRFSFEIIFHAYEITVESQGTFRLNYMDSILKAWHEKNLTSLEAIRSDDQAHSKVRAQKRKDRTEGSKDRPGSFDTEDFFADAVRRSLGEDFHWKSSD